MTETLVELYTCEQCSNVHSKTGNDPKTCKYKQEQADGKYEVQL